MNKLILAYKEAREKAIDAVNKFPLDKRTEVLFENWSLREVIIHMAGWDNCIADNVKYQKEGKEPPFYGKVDDFNKSSVEKGVGLSWEQAYEEFIKAGERVIQEYESLPENLWNTPFWKDKKSTPASFLKIVTKHYEEEHLPLIRKFL